MPALNLKEVENHLSVKLESEIRIESNDVLGGGCINHASKINTNVGSFFLKWNGNCASDIFVREAESLNELKKAAKGNLILPNVIASKEVDSSAGFLVQEYLEPGHASSDNDEKLGRGLALMHQYTNASFGFYHNNYCGATLQDNTWSNNWAEFFRDNRLRFLLHQIQKERPLPLPEIKLFEKLLDKIPDLLPITSVPVLMHGDLWSGNYLITKTGPALIDPASYYADSEMEFAIITMFGGFSQRFYDAYAEINPLEPEWQQRNKLYRLYHILNHYYLFGGGYRSQAIEVARYFT